MTVERRCERRMLWPLQEGSACGMALTGVSDSQDAVCLLQPVRAAGHAHLSA